MPILIKGEYDIWAMKMEHYLAHTDYPIWEVIQNGNGPVSITTDTSGQIKMWDAIKSRFVGNDESKKMQKYILKQQFEGFSISNTEGLYKGYDRSLPSAWSQVSLIMRTKPGVDSLSFDDLYNNLRVFESDVKGSTASSSSPQNVAFVSENTSSTNEICPQLDHEDLEQIDEYDLEEMDLKWQMAMISMRMKSFYKKTGKLLRIHSTHSQKPKVDKKELGYGFTVRACFVCGSLNHLIRDCDFHEKRMARKAELNNGWNNVQRVNKQNQFVPSAVLTRTGKIPVSTARASGTKNFRTARQSFNRQTVLTCAAMEVNTVKPTVNRVRPANVFHKTHSPFSRPFKKTTVLRTDFSKQKVNTAKVNAVSTVGGKGKLLLSPQQVVIRDHKDTTGTMSPNTMVDPVLEIAQMTGNKAYLAEFQDFNGGPVAFGGSKGYITGKGKIKTGKLDFEDVCFVKELQHFNLFSVSQMCDKKNKVLFTDSECLVLSPEFKLPDENQVLLKIPRQNNMYSFNLENIFLQED
ncbi:hypothetical protein Tco_0185455 [Tanacetum coccineum]